MFNKIVKEEYFCEISPADFFYRNRDIAGFSNPVRAIYSAIREFVENSLDASELYGYLPDVYVRVSVDEESKGSGDTNVYILHVEDNGSGVPPQHIPSAFGQVLYGSKYRLRQSRGTFGLGGTMAILYGQITTNSPVKVISSTGRHSIHEYVLMIDVQRNQPIVLKHKTYKNENHWHGTVIEVKIEGDFSRAFSKILEYFKQTAIVAPYANITFVDVKGRLYRFERVVSQLPKPPLEIKPHPYGCDVETIKRIISATKCRDMLSFMMFHFHRIGKITAKKFLKFANIPEKKKPKSLSNDEIVKLVKAMKEFNGFRVPSADCLSPLGENLLKAGIQKELNPEFISVRQRKPSVYSGYPFIVEVAVAYGGNIPVRGDVILYRFANRIPLLYDEASDVSWKVVHNLINWRHYKIDIQNSPIAVFVHICSTKIPYRSVGKEFIADIPEIEREILGGLRETLRDLSIYLTRRRTIEMEKRKFDIFEKYLPKIANFSAELAGSKDVPDVKPLLRRVIKYGAEKIDEG